MTKKSTEKTLPKKVSKTTSSKKTATEDSTKIASVSRDLSASEKKKGSLSFSIDDVEALVATRVDAEKPKASKKAVKKQATQKVEVEEEPIEKRVIGAASLSDILGFNPAKKESPQSLEETSVPQKWKKYYNLLIELRSELSEDISLHTSNTFQHNSDDHAGDQKLEDDAGTDAFDRDFALSLVSSEQEALNEIEEALLRIKQGSYGVCEVTGQPISKDRLTAVPFTRFSVEGQVEFEKNNRRKVDRSAGGVFADSEDSPKMISDDDD